MKALTGQQIEARCQKILHACCKSVTVRLSVRLSVNLLDYSSQSHNFIKKKDIWAFLNIVGRLIEERGRIFS